MTTKENTTKDLKDQDETVDTTQKSKSKEPKKKENPEEEEEEVEVEEEIEEKEDEEEEADDEEKNENEPNPNPLPPKTKDGLEISMELIKKFKENSKEENDDAISDFILEKGLPMEVKDEHTLSLILYFHKLCVSFLKIFNSLKKKNIEKIFLSSLKESYFLFADETIKHYNYKALAQKIFPNLKKSQEEFLISVEFNNQSFEESLIPTPSVFKINQKILELGKSKNFRIRLK